MRGDCLCRCHQYQLRRRPTTRTGIHLNCVRHGHLLHSSVRNTDLLKLTRGRRHCHGWPSIENAAKGVRSRPGPYPSGKKDARAQPEESAMLTWRKMYRNLQAGAVGIGMDKLVVGDCFLARGVEHGQAVRTAAFRARTRSGSCTEL